METETPVSKGRLPSTILAGAVLQGLVILSLLIIGHFGRNIRDLVIIYLSFDVLAMVLGKRTGVFERVWARLGFYACSVALLLAYALIVNFIRERGHL